MQVIFNAYDYWYQSIKQASREVTILTPYLDDTLLSLLKGSGLYKSRVNIYTSLDEEEDLDDIKSKLFTLKNLYERGFEVKIIDHLHAKCVISDNVIYIGSQNLTHRGKINKELTVQFEFNKNQKFYRTIKEWLDNAYILTLENILFLLDNCTTHHNLVFSIRKYKYSSKIKFVLYAKVRPRSYDYNTKYLDFQKYTYKFRQYNLAVDKKIFPAYVVNLGRFFYIRLNNTSASIMYDYVEYNLNKEFKEYFRSFDITSVSITFLKVESVHDPNIKWRFKSYGRALYDCYIKYNGINNLSIHKKEAQEINEELIADFESMLFNEGGYLNNKIFTELLSSFYFKHPIKYGSNLIKTIFGDKYQWKLSFASYEDKYLVLIE